jgi:cobalamin biosynthesis protein CobW
MAADLIVVNKADLLDETGIDRLKGEIANVVPRAVKVVPAHEGRIDPAVLLGLAAAAEDDLDARPSHHDGADDHEHDDFETFVVEIGEIDRPDALVERLRDVAEAHDILRIKGFVAVKDKPMRLAVQGVGARFRHAFDRPWNGSERRVGRLVVIGETGLDRTAIETAIRG